MYTHVFENGEDNSNHFVEKLNLTNRNKHVVWEDSELQLSDALVERYENRHKECHPDYGCELCRDVKSIEKVVEGCTVAVPVDLRPKGGAQVNPGSRHISDKITRKGHPLRRNLPKKRSQSSSSTSPVNNVGQSRARSDWLSGDSVFTQNTVFEPSTRLRSGKLASSYRDNLSMNRTKTTSNISSSSRRQHRSMYGDQHEKRQSGSLFGVDNLVHLAEIGNQGLQDHSLATIVLPPQDKDLLRKRKRSNHGKHVDVRDRPSNNSYRSNNGSYLGGGVML
jgi:hypothetical protein